MIRTLHRCGSMCLPVVFCLIAGCAEPPAQPGMPLIRVNDRIITDREFRRDLEEHGIPPSGDEIRRFADQTVTRELLIQEALRRGLDRKESFRRTLKRFYEETLLKDLTTEQARTLTPTVDPSEVRRRYERMKRALRLRIKTTFPDGQTTTKETTVETGDLPKALEDAAYSLRPGEASKPVVENGTTRVLTLLGSIPLKPPPLEELKEEILRDLREGQRMKSLNAWMDELRKQADVVVDTDQLRRMEAPHGERL